jgi:hypothetical protein
VKDDIFIGVDPGLSGAIAAVRGDGTLIGSWDLPTVSASKGGKELHLTEIRRMILRLVGNGPAHAAIEKVHAMPGQGVVSMFRFGRATGQLEGILVGHGRITMLNVRPQEWQKALRHADGGDNKAKSVIAASMRFPDLELPRKKDHNRAEAALIADYCRKYHQGDMKNG